MRRHVDATGGVMCIRRREPKWLPELKLQLSEIQKGQHKIMALVQVEQTTLDDLAVALEAAKVALAAEIAALQTAVPAADLSGLNQALADLQALEAPSA